MNILILQGSPRANGNTAWMAEEFQSSVRPCIPRQLLPAEQPDFIT